MPRNEQAIGSEDGVDSKTQPSGVEDTYQDAAEPRETRVRSNDPENTANRLNPSAPAETGTTPGINTK